MTGALGEGNTVEATAESGGGGVQRVRVERTPYTRGQAEQKRLDGGDGFGGGEGAVAGAMDESLPQERGIPRSSDDTFVGGFVLNNDQAITVGVHGEDGDVDLTVENDVGFKIVNRFGVGGDAHRVLKCLEIGVEAQPRSLIESRHFLLIDGTIKLRAVVDARVR